MPVEADEELRDGAGVDVGLRIVPGDRIRIRRGDLQRQREDGEDHAGLVPGAFTTIIADCLCRPVTADMVLTAVDVTWGPDGEVVQVTYAQLTSINTGEIF